MDRTTEVLTMKRVAWRLLPLLFAMMMINYLDRVNVGFAALRMNQDLGFSAAVYGFGAGVFFIGYAVVEVPSNMLLHRFGARVWICRIMITWGPIAAGMAFVRDAKTFYTLRFLLGVAEAGFLPGVVFYISEWFPARYRARANARVFIATLFAPVIGGPASTYILTAMHGVAGIPGWQWMFILEGIPAVLLGLFVLVHLTNTPGEAAWLEPGQRSWLVQTLAEEKATLERHQSYTLRQVFRDKRVWQLGCLFSCLNAGSYGMLLWMPQIIRSLGTMTDLEIGTLSALPFLLGAVGQVLVSRHSDKVRERKNHLACCYFAAGAALVASAVAPSSGLAFGCLCVVGATLYAGTPIFWTLVGSFMTGAAGAVGIALINTIAQVAGFFGPYLVGVLKDETQSFAAPLALLAGFLFTAAILAVTLKNRLEGDEADAAHVGLAQLETGHAL